MIIYKSHDYCCVTRDNLPLNFFIVFLLYSYNIKRFSQIVSETLTKLSVQYLNHVPCNVVEWNFDYPNAHISSNFFIFVCCSTRNIIVLCASNMCVWCTNFVDDGTMRFVDEYLSISMDDYSYHEFSRLRTQQSLCRFPRTEYSYVRAVVCGIYGKSIFWMKIWRRVPCSVVCRACQLLLQTSRQAA